MNIKRKMIVTDDPLAEVAYILKELSLGLDKRVLQTSLDLEAHQGKSDKQIKKIIEELNTDMQVSSDLAEYLNQLYESIINDIGK